MEKLKEENSIFLYIFPKMCAHFELDVSSAFLNTQTGICLPLCCISSLFSASIWHLGTVETFYFFIDIAALDLTAYSQWLDLVLRLFFLFVSLCFVMFLLCFVFFYIQPYFVPILKQNRDILLIK